MNTSRSASQSSCLTPRVLAAFTLCSLGVLLGMVSFASGTQNGWSIVNSPNTPPVPTANNPKGITCVSASDCWAVGFYFNGNVNQTLIEHWDGTSWVVVSSPNSSISKDNFLEEVSCSSPSDCWAAGYHLTVTGMQTLIVRWDGTAWSIASSPNTSPTKHNFLLGITCNSASNCWAVGYHYNGIAYQTLIEHWDGAVWTIAPSANANTNQANFLVEIDCTSSSDCWAVGYYFNGSFNQTLVQHWNGTAWTIVASPNTSATQGNVFTAITCVSASDCWAVGYYSNGVADQTLTEHWDGTAWTIVSSPSTLVAQHNRLEDVTCASTSNCWAVGFYLNGNVYQTLIERWDGNSWVIATSPNSSITQENRLAGVTCASASDCWTVGHYFNGNVNQTLIERRDATSWTIVTSPNALVRPNNRLAAVTCVSASDCWAVGYYYNGDVNQTLNQTLIEHWDGTSWTIANSPNTLVVQHNRLAAVTCVSASDCWAVGFYDDGGVNQTLIVHWNGTSWSIVTSANVGIAQDNALTAITCQSASNCWAVGSYSNGSFNQTLIEHWDGTSWMVVTSPNTSITQNNALLTVTCESASNCWAAGNYFNGTAFQTLIERWNGSSWTLVPSPNANTRSNFLQGVTCGAASDCWAAGYYFDGSVNQTLVERWNGTSWTVVSSPNAGSAQTNFLVAATCESASNCWATGFYFSNGNVVQTMIQRWDGTAWTIVNSPNTTTTQNNLLFGVTCTSASDCWAVGYNVNAGGVIQTLTQHYAVVLPPVPTSVVSRKVHGTAGTFDINLPLTGNLGIEPRKGQGPNSDQHQVVLTFTGPATVASAACDGNTAATTTAGNDVTVNCTAVPNGKLITIALTGVTVGANSGDVSVPMGTLLGDVNANKVVSNTDVSAAKAQVSSPVTESNFLSDVNANGIVSNTDVSVTKAQVSTSLP